jgi:acyl-homoserine lactone synthase
MITVNVVDKNNFRRFEPVLDSMFRDRKRLFVDLMKWQLPMATATHDVDQFDTDDAVYLVAINPEDGTHMGSMRLLPTTGPHILGDLFPRLCENGVPRGDDILEVTRFCPSPRVKNRDRLMECRLNLGTAMIEYGLLRGLKGYSACTYMSWTSKLLAAGWRIRPLGLPEPFEDDAINAIEIEVSPSALAEMRTICGQTQPLLSWVREAHEDLPAAA